MSNINTLLNLQPPHRMENKEVILSKSHTCGYCFGNGFFWEDGEYGEALKNKCPICKGTGKVDAHITIEWKPSKTMENK